MEKDRRTFDHELEERFPGMREAFDSLMRSCVLTRERFCLEMPEVFHTQRRTIEDRLGELEQRFATVAPVLRDKALLDRLNSDIEAAKSELNDVKAANERSGPRVPGQDATKREGTESNKEGVRSDKDKE